jgi:hypothetical protein
VLCEATSLNLREIVVHPIQGHEEERFQRLMQEHHYLGALAKIGRTLWYVATWKGQWVALLSFSAAAWKCAARDRWIGWDFRHQYDRLHLIANNSRFLILPAWHRPNLASRVLSLCERRLARDWPQRFGHPLLLLETFVDPRYFRGTLYLASNWLYVGETRGFRRTRQGYSDSAQAPKRVFVRPLSPQAEAVLSCPVLDPPYHNGAPKIMLSAERMRSLPGFFSDLPDPRSRHGRRHALPTVLAIAAAATLCGMRGYKAIAEWADDLGQKARARFRCRYRNRRYEVPSESIIRDVLIRVDPDHLDHALQRWNAAHGEADESLAIDGKTMCNAIDKAGRQTHILSAVGHQTHTCYTQKKWGRCR